MVRQWASPLEGMRGAAIRKRWNMNYKFIKISVGEELPFASDGTQTFVSSKT